MAKRRRLTRRQKIQRRNRMILASVVALVVLAVILVAVIKGCADKSDDINANATGSANEAVSSASNEVQTKETVTQPSTEETTEETTQETTPAGNYTANGFLIEEIDGATYIDGVLIANKTYGLPSTFVPTNPENPVTEERSVKCLDKDLMNAWNSLLKDATKEGLNLYISSGYRSYDYQSKIYNNYVKADGVEKADTYSSRPGNSEHQTGLCFDLNTIEDSFQYTEEGKWVNDNCYKYGFCIRFPKGKEEYTGYQYESWHLRYVGEELATKLYNNGDWISLEEYFGITSEYSN